MQRSQSPLQLHFEPNQPLSERAPKAKRADEVTVVRHMPPYWVDLGSVQDQSDTVLQVFRDFTRGHEADKIVAIWFASVQRAVSRSANV